MIALIMIMIMAIVMMMITIMIVDTIKIMMLISITIVYFSCKALFLEDLLSGLLTFIPVKILITSFHSKIRT